MLSLLNRKVKWLALAGLALGLAACSPTSYVVLLPNDDGTTGSIVVTGKDGKSTAVDKPREGAALDGSSEKPFKVEQAKIDQDFSASMEAQPLKPKSFMLYFKTGTAELTEESRALFPVVLAEVKNRPAPDISIIGHTDTKGKPEENAKLGLIRANEIAAQLELDDEDRKRLAVTSHGEANPLVPTPDDTDEPKNRRVEITIR